MPTDILEYLPKQWVGLAALILFGVYIVLQVIEKYPVIARAFPFGLWWHERQRKKRPRLDEAIEDNEVIKALREQLSGVVQHAVEQDIEIAALHRQARIARAWSEYDARYHNRVAIENARTEACKLPRHYDIYEFEHVWRTDPSAAAQL